MSNVMNCANLNNKRQILADLLGGNIDALRTYRANQRWAKSPYRWIVEDETSGTIYGIGKDGSQHPMSLEELTAAPQNNIWYIVDHSDGRRIPEADEEYR